MRIAVRLFGLQLLELELERQPEDPGRGDAVSVPAGFATGGRWDPPALPSLDVD